VIDEYQYQQADCVVVETNKGGDLVEKILRSMNANIPFKGVVATRGKITRAEPIAALYEQGKVFHTKPFLKLEQQLCTYVGHQSSKSPDRMDALVWAVTDLMLESNYQSPLKVWNFE
jgi:phage terminase large subunit-like protein